MLFQIVTNISKDKPMLTNIYICYKIIPNVNKCQQMSKDAYKCLQCRAYRVVHSLKNWFYSLNMAPFWATYSPYTAFSQYNYSLLKKHDVREL